MPTYKCARLRKLDRTCADFRIDAVGRSQAARFRTDFSETIRREEGTTSCRQLSFAAPEIKDDSFAIGRFWLPRYLWIAIDDPLEIFWYFSHWLDDKGGPI